ncbi:MAG: DedD protein [Limisphaerales bacterium]
MHERTRYRISGSLFLLALAVIFIPMVFDGGGYPAETIPPIPLIPRSSEITPTPTYDEVVPTTSVVAEVAELAAEVDDFGFSSETGEKFGEPILIPANSETEIWAVQAASFAKIGNARSLRQALRELGLEAFISTAVDPADDKSPPRHRVAVGPLLERRDGVAIVEQIRQAFDVEPQLVEMQP